MAYGPTCSRIGSNCATRGKARGAAGLSGMRAEHLKLLLQDAEALELLADAATLLARASVPPEIQTALAMARLTALRKPDGVRARATFLRLHYIADHSGPQEKNGTDKTPQASNLTRDEVSIFLGGLCSNVQRGPLLYDAPCQMLVQLVSAACSITKGNVRMNPESSKRRRRM